MMSLNLEKQNIQSKKTEAMGVGNTILLAQKNACELLNIVDDQVEFEVVQLPEKKKFGIFGGRQAKVIARIKNRAADYELVLMNKILTSVTDKKINSEVTKKENEIVFNLSGDGVSDIAENNENLINSIQYLTSLMISQRESSYRKVKINAEGFEEIRKKFIEKTVSNAVQKAKRTGKRVDLDPMNSYERLIAHQAVKKFKGVLSCSEGEGKDRHIVIEPSLT